MPAALPRERWGTMPDGTPIERVALGDGAGFEARVITFGAAVQALSVPDRHGAAADVVLGFDDAAGYLARRTMFGATVGRYANRIAGASFALDGVVHRLPANNGANTLHGGPAGFDRHNWTIDDAGGGPAPFVRMSRISPDGEEGFPGTVHATVTYRVTAPGTLAMEWTATTDQATVVNLTHHGFFNLAGPGVDGVVDGGGILGHVVEVFSDAFLPVDASAIPRGGPEAVAGTPFDFRTPHVVGERIRVGHEQMRLGKGYDHTWCLPGGRVAEPRLAARVHHPGSGRTMELLTDQAGVQFYSGNFLDGSVAGKGGRLCRQSDALCLEPQIWPDTPNRADFASARLDPGETYRHRSVFRFHAA